MTEAGSETVAPETFQDVRDDANRAVVKLIPLLVLTYVVGFSVLLVGLTAISISVFTFSNPFSFSFWLDPFWVRYTIFAAIIGAIVAFVHSYSAYHTPIDYFIHRIGGESLDDDDHYHRILQNVVDEITIAADLGDVYVGVSPTSAANALAVGDRERAAIVITEGTLGRLRRDELQAVVAHEIAHVAYGDSRLKFFTGNLLDSFDFFSEYSDKKSKVIKWGCVGCLPGFFFALLSVFTVAVTTAVVQFLNRLMSATISLSRERRADATAIEYCRDPVALASALHKLGLEPMDVPSVFRIARSREIRNSLYSPAFESLLFVPFDPKTNRKESASSMDEILRSHPPVRERIHDALNLAEVSEEELERRLDNEQQSPHVPVRSLRDSEGNRLVDQNWMVQGEGGEEQPADLVGLLSGGALSEDTLLRREQEENWHEPGEHPEFGKVQKIYDTDADHGTCPDCGARLRPRFYLGVPIEACVLCGGVVLSWRKTLRLEARHRDGEPSEEEQDPTELEGYHGEEDVEEGEKTGRTCPSCGSSMIAQKFEETPLIVDLCTSCESFWFEEGELDAALNVREKNPDSE